MSRKPIKMQCYRESRCCMFPKVEFSELGECKMPLTVDRNDIAKMNVDM